MPLGFSHVLPHANYTMLFFSAEPWIPGTFLLQLPVSLVLAPCHWHHFQLTKCPGPAALSVCLLTPPKLLRS